MNIATNNTIAKIAAVVAGLGLVAMSFAYAAPAAKADAATDAQIAALMAQIEALKAGMSSSSSASVTFTRDLTVGATGADVTALQTWLIGKGFAIPAGATGYFGAQTVAALAAYQAANGIAPAAGYFGPITRAKVNASAGTSTGGTGSTGGSTSTGSLKGGEADLSDFELRREESTGNEGEEEVAVATAEFDVEDGDIEVQRLELLASSTDSADNQKPWDYFDHVYIMQGSKTVADMDVDSRDDWDEEDDDVYRLSITDLDAIVRDGDRAELTIAFDINDSIDQSDQDQHFVFQIPEDGIRAVDAAGIQQYTGISSSQDELPGTDSDETVDFTFGAEENGDLSVRSNSDDPDSTTLISDEDDESDEYTVFVFDVKNDDDADSLITDLTIGVTETGTGDATDQIRRATLTVDGDDFDGDINAASIDFDDIDVQVDGDSTQTFELAITLTRGSVDNTLRFNVVGSTGIEAEGVESGDDVSGISGTATSETHTVASTGVMVSDGSTTARADDDSLVGTFTIDFTVDALEDDVYIYNDAADVASTGVRYNIFSGSTNISGTTSDSALLQSDADMDGSYYVVREGQSEDFTLTVTLDPALGSGTNLYFVELEAIKFNDEPASDGATTYTVPDVREFETNAVSLKAS